MIKIISYSAVSLNFKIAREDGSVDWLEDIDNPDKLDYGYYNFYNSIESTIMGYNTYAQLKSWDIEFPYKEKKNYVFTHRKHEHPDPNVTFVTQDHLEFAQNLKGKSEGHVWLVGGAGLNGSFLNAGLIDELVIFVMPVILENGIDLFANNGQDFHLNNTGLKQYPNGVVEIKYSLKY